MNGHIEVFIDRLVVDRWALVPGEGPDSPTAALLEAALARELHRALVSSGAQGSVLPAPRTGEDVRELVTDALRRVLAARADGSGDGHG